MGRRLRWVNGFVSELTRQQSGLRDFQIEFVRTPQENEMLARLLGRFKEQGVRLLIVPGTDSAVRIVGLRPDVTVLYFGAHPENNGLELVDHPRVSGVRLNLPLIWRYENFSLLKALCPDLSHVYFPLNLDSEFAFSNIRRNYAIHRSRSPSFWISGSSTGIGYRSVQFLAERLGIEYLEGPYSNTDELTVGLDSIAPTNSAIVGFNDTVLNDGAVSAILECARARRIPVFWVNNAAIVKSAGVADFSSDFEAVGRILANMTLSILRDGVSIESLSFADDPGQKLTLNLPACRELGLDVPPEVERRFDEVFR
jgi:hypothetical protein